MDAGVNFVEAVPSDAAWARAVPAVAPLRPGFKTDAAVILPGASANPDFDIAQLQGLQKVKEDAFSLRLDYRFNNRWSMYARGFHDQGTNNQPEGVSGRVVSITDNPSNAVFNLQGLLSDRTTNDLKIGYNSAPTRINGIAPVVNGIDFGNIVLNLSGSVANTGIAGQGASSGIVVPGGLVRANSATNGRGQPYDPYTISLIDSISPFNNGATGPRHVKQEYYIGFFQDEWRISQLATLNMGLRYEYYTPLTETDDLQVKFNIDNGVIDPNTTRPYKTNTDSLLPRVSFTYAPGKTVLRSGFGVFVGPGQTEDQIQPVESDRVSSTISSGAFPVDQNALIANFVNNPNNRSYQPRAYANEYSIPERIYQYTFSVQRELPGNMSATAAYVGSQGRNLFLRSVANNIVQVLTNPNPANAALVIREFSIVQRNAAGQVTGVQNPFAEVDYKTSGGRDNYNALQLSLNKRSSKGLATNVQYRLGRSRGNTAGSNEAQTAANNARAVNEFDYDIGYNSFDVRHTFNLSVLYEIPYKGTGAAGTLFGDWQVGGIVNARSGLPVPVQIVRPDVVYRDAAGNIFASQAVDRIAIINTPRGGSSRNVRRPDLLPGVDPFIQADGLLFLNPAAFATPQPGTFGNLERNSIHGPNFKQVDLVLSKRFMFSGTRNFEFRAEIFNLFNTVNFSNPVGTLPQAIPNTSLTEANRVQPGQPYTNAAAGTFGTLTGTVGRSVGLGTPRQAQLAFRVSF